MKIIEVQNPTHDGFLAKEDVDNSNVLIPRIVDIFLESNRASKTLFGPTTKMVQNVLFQFGLQGCIIFHHQRCIRISPLTS